MRFSTAIACALLALAPLLSSCGGESETAAGSPPRTQRGAPTRPSHDSCRPQLRDFIDSLASLRRNLSRGLSYTEYLPEVRHVRTTYQAIKPRKLDATCLLLSGGPAEQAFNFYIDAANTWGECLTTIGCTTASVEAKLQSKWAHASNKLSKAERAVEGESG